MNSILMGVSTLLAVSAVGVLGAPAQAVDAPQGPIEQLKLVVGALDDTHAHVVRANDFARELLRIVGDDSRGAEMKAACDSVSMSGFGEPYSIGSSGFGTVPEAFPVVFSATGRASVIDELFILPIEASWMPNGVLPTGTAVFVYSARFGNGPGHVGVCTVVDTWVAGIATSPDAPLRTVVSFTPLDLIDPTSLVSGPSMVEFMQRAVSGEFDEDGTLHQWIFERVRHPSMHSLSSGVDGGCNETALMECLQLTDTNLENCLRQLGPTFDRIGELEKRLKDCAKSAVTAATSGAVAGFVVGAWDGAAAGPLGSLLGALGGAALGAAGGLIAWALLEDPAEINAELASAREQLQNQFCACQRQWAASAKQCFSTDCPDLAEIAGSIIDAQVARGGC